jgi:DNA-binding transcriptional LysR family regulator
MAAMQAFVLVVDSGSFSAAACRLNVGQPAVSKSVAQLEDRLGVKLMARSFARIHLMPWIPEFLARHPDLEIEVVLDDRNIDLVQEGIDVALRMGHLADSALTARRIASGRHAVLGTPIYFARAGEPAAPADLIGHETVIYARAPSATKRRAVASPMPVLPPVTTAILPSKRDISLLLSSGESRRLRICLQHSLRGPIVRVAAA